MTVATATMSAMEISDYIHALNDQGVMLVNAAYYGGLDAAVPTCPPWRARDLLYHMGYVHRWATRYVTNQVTDMMPELTEAEQLAAGPPDDELHTWYLDGLGALVNALASADPDMRAWTFLPAPSPLTFWARRQAHETAIHCADAQMAAGFGHAYVADFAADGIDELLIAFFGAESADPSAVGDTRGTRCLLVRAADTGQDWHVRLSDDGSKIIATARGSCPAESAACTLAGPAWGLYLLLWNRVDPAAAEVTVSGDEQVLRAWRDGTRLTWG
jgi:uncharacterized protein (TIGR03083 family)